jgi:glycopeptide antibiotics resistance protein
LFPGTEKLTIEGIPSERNEKTGERNGMIEIPFIAGEALYTTVWLLNRTVIWTRQKHIDWKREAVLFLMYVNLAVILRFTFFPFDRINGHIQPLIFDPSTAYPFRMNLIPLRQLLWYETRRELYVNVLGNIAMFIPCGILLPLIYRKLDRFWKVLLAGMLISLCIEIVQLPFGVRGSDIDDILLNTAGTSIGYGIYLLTFGLKRKRA